MKKDMHNCTAAGVPPPRPRRGAHRTPGSRPPVSPIAFCLVTVMVLGACQNPVMREVDGRVFYHARVFPLPEHGTLRLGRDRAAAGNSITVYVNPDPGYRLQDGSLKYQSEVAGNASPVPKIGAKYEVSITGYNIAVTAVFEPVSAGIYTVSVDPSIENGFISADPLYGPPGTPVRFTLIPNPGCDLAAGTLTVNGTPISEALPYAYTLGNGHITVSVRFEEQGYDGLKASAWKYLDAGEYGTAASFYEEAYKKNRADPETVMYTVFAKLGNLLLDNDVRSVLGAMNMAYIPSTLDDWICDEDWEGSPWYQTWSGVVYDTEAENKNPPQYVHTRFTTEDATLPRLNTRLSGFVGQFGDYNIAQGTNPDTRQKFSNLIFWILLSKNSSGFNGLLERINRYVFGEKFEAAAAIAASFPEDGRVRLNDRLKRRFKLDQIYGPGDTWIGKAELDYVFARLRAAKAAFEYLASYDWTIDLRPWLTSEIMPDDGLDQILHKVFNQGNTNDNHKPYWANPSTVATILPLKNKFLTVRHAPLLDKARADITAAVNLANSAMNEWYGPSGAFTDAARDRYRWAKDGLASAKTALDQNGVFYFPKKLPKSEPGSVWPEESAADYGISLQQFFRPGAFTLTKLFTTEWGGKAPSMFKLEWYEDRNDGYKPVFTGGYRPVTGPIPDSDSETNVAGTGNEAPRGIYTFEVNTGYLKQLFPKGFSQYGERALLSDVFRAIPLWPARPAYFMGGRANLSARDLYYYYHWR